MKLISILLREFKLDDVKQALSEVDVVALTVVEARDYSPQFHGTAAWRAICTPVDHRYSISSGRREA